MNCYESVGVAKSDLGLSGSTHDARLLRYLEGASRAIDRWCHRFFYTEIGTRYQSAVTVSARKVILLDADVLSVTAFDGDSEYDASYDGESWTENTDFWLWPYSAWPKLKVEETGFGSYGLVCARRFYRMAGTWGYGDGLRADPWDATGYTATLADATATALTIAGADATGTVSAGMTIRMESEQLYVTGASYASPDTTLTVVRGVNGTTAAAHAAKAIAAAAYPADVKRFCSWLAQSEFTERRKQGMQQERMGDYFYTRMSSGDAEKKMARCLAPYVRAF